MQSAKSNISEIRFRPANIVNTTNSVNKLNKSVWQCRRVFFFCKYRYFATRNGYPIQIIIKGTLKKQYKIVEDHRHSHPPPEFDYRRPLIGYNIVACDLKTYFFILFQEGKKKLSSWPANDFRGITRFLCT